MTTMYAELMLKLLQRIADGAERIAAALENDVAGAIGLLGDELALPLDRMADTLAASAADPNPVGIERGES